MSLLCWDGAFSSRCVARRTGRRWRDLMTGGLRERPPQTSGLEFWRSHLALRTSSRGSRHFVSRTVLIWANSNFARAILRNSANLGISCFQRQTAEVLTLAREAALESLTPLVRIASYMMSAA